MEIRYREEIHRTTFTIKYMHRETTIIFKKYEKKKYSNGSVVN